MQSFGDFVDDLERVYGLAKAWIGERRFVLFGHSMGALIALRAISMDRIAPDLLVLQSCPIELCTAPSLAKRVLARSLRVFAGGAKLSSDLDATQLSSDPWIQRATLEDPRMQAKVSVRLGLDVLDAIRSAAGRAARVRAPTLVVHGSEDSIAHERGAKRLSDALTAAPDVSLRIVSGARHEPHNELAPIRKEAFATISSWIEERCAAFAE